MKNAITILTIVVLLFTNSDAIAQNGKASQIMALVLNEEGVKVEAGNVILLSTADSSFIRGDIFFDGELNISNINEGRVILKISALGYKDFYQNVIVDESGSKILDDITLQAAWLEGVEIIGRKKMFEVKGSDMVVNVEQTALSNAGSVLDIIRNSPKVIVNSAGNISILGKGNALIYLDGQLISSNQILNDLSSNEIKKIEIIENPSSKYDAAGNAVINIVTKKKTMEGYKIGLVQELGRGKFNRGNFQATSFFKYKKILLQASYGFQPWTFGSKFRQTTTLESPGNVSIADNLYLVKFLRLDNSITGKSIYEINDDSSLGIQYVGTFQNVTREADNFRTVLNNGSPAFEIDSEVGGPFSQNSNTLNAFYQLSLDSLGSELSINTQYSNFYFLSQNTVNQDFLTNGTTNIIQRRSRSENAIQIYSIQADYTKYISDKLSLQSGIKSANIITGNLVQFEGFDNNTWSLLPEFSNQYDYQENISAAYFQLAWNKAVSINAGVRAERTNTQGQSGEGGEANLIDRTYLDIFPSLNVSKSFSEKLNASINYTNRINRPVFQDLNPYILYVDSLVSLRGNPNLTPEYSHGLSASLGVNKLNISLNYTYTKDKINQIFRSVDPNNPNVIAFVKENLNFTELYSLSLSHPINFRSFSAYLTIGGFYDDHNIDDIEGQLGNQKPGFMASGNLSYNLPYDIILNAFFNYTSARVDGVYIDNPISFINVSLSKSFLKDHLKVILHANDVLDKYRYTGVSKFNNMRMDYLTEGDWHYAKLTLRWDFGKLGANAFNRKGISNDELNRIGKTSTKKI